LGNPADFTLCKINSISKKRLILPGFLEKSHPHGLRERLAVVRTGHRATSPAGFGGVGRFFFNNV
jgi:hypothetical protein